MRIGQRCVRNHENERTTADASSQHKRNSRDAIPFVTLQMQRELHGVHCRCVGINTSWSEQQIPMSS